MTTPESLDGVNQPFHAFIHSAELPLFGGIRFDWRNNPNNPLFSVPEGRGGLPVNGIFPNIAFPGETPTKRLFLHQAESFEDLEERQAVIAELSMLELSRFKGAKRLYDDADLFTSAHSEEMRLVVDHERSSRDYTAYATNIELYARHAKKDPNGHYLRDGYPVWNFKQYIESSRTAATFFVERYGTQMPRLAQALNHKSAWLPDPNKFQPTEYIAKKGRPKNIRPQLEQQLAVAEEQRVVYGVVDATVNGFIMNPVRLRGDNIVIKGISHAKFRRGEQELHDVTIDNTPIVLTGRNGSGKTHLLESIGLAVISAGSVGASTVAKGSTIERVDGLVAGYRPGGGNNGLSAFGTEAKEWGGILEWFDQTLGDRKLILADEPFSTTDPHEQLEIITALTRYISERGGKLVLTSHSDVTELVSSGIVQAYQFISGGDRKRLLAEGVGDAQSFDVAEENGFSQEVLAKARQYYEGAEFQIHELAISPMDEVPSLSTWFSANNPGLRWFVDRNPVRDPSSKRYGHEDFEYWRDQPQKQDTQCNYVLGDENFLDTSLNTGRTWWSSDKTNALSEMLQNLSTTNEADLALRQEFFENLGAYEHVEELALLIEDFKNIVFGLSAHCDRVGDSELRDFYNGANPSIDPGLSILLVLKDLSGAPSKDQYGFEKASSKDQHLERLQVLRETLLKASEYFGEDLDQETNEIIEEYANLVERFLELVNESPKTINTDDEGYKTTLIEVDTSFRDSLYAFCDKITRLADEKEDDESDDEYDSEMYRALRDLLNIRTKDAPYNLRHIWENLNNVFLDYEGGQFNYETYEQAPRNYSLPETVQFDDFVGVVSALLGRNGNFSNPGLLSIVHVLIESRLNENLDAGRTLGSTQQKAFTDLADIVATSQKELGLEIKSGYLLKSLRFLCSSDDLLGQISVHLNSVGGEIAEGLAEYVDKSFRAYFLGGKTGYDYFKAVQEQLKKKIPIVTEQIIDSRRLKQEEEKRKGHKPRPVLVPTRADLYKQIVYNERFGTHGSTDKYREIGSINLARTEVLANGHASRTPVTPYSDTEVVLQIIGIARAMKESGYSRPDSSNTLAANAVKPPLSNKEFVVTPFEYGTTSGIDVISGSNMSGKTQFGRNLFMNLAFCRATGLVPSDGLKTPRYDRVVYIDRPKQDSGKGLSSAMADFKNWQKAFELLENAAPSFVFIDEPFSSVPADYQKALLLASLEWLASKGHRVVVATHNHEAMDILKKASVGSVVPITFHNLLSVAQEDGDINFSRQFTEGIASSMAKEVARLIGGASLARIFNN